MVGPEVDPKQTVLCADFVCQVDLIQGWTIKEGYTFGMPRTGDPIFARHFDRLPGSQPDSSASGLQGVLSVTGGSLGSFSGCCSRPPRFLCPFKTCTKSTGDSPHGSRAACPAARLLMQNRADLSHVKRWPTFFPHGRTLDSSTSPRKQLIAKAADQPMPIAFADMEVFYDGNVNAGFRHCTQARVACTKRQVAHAPLRQKISSALADTGTCRWISSTLATTWPLRQVPYPSSCSCPQDYMGQHTGSLGCEVRGRELVSSLGLPVPRQDKDAAAFVSLPHHVSQRHM